MQQYLADYGLYSAFAMVSWLALTLWTKDIFLKRAAHFLFALAVGLLASGITGHFLADKIDSVKMAWYWRASYYSFLPLSLLSSIAIYQLAIKNRPRYIALRISLLSIVLFIYTTPDGIYSTAKSNLETTTKIHNGEIQDRYNTELKQIINTINSSQASSAVLFPPKSFQGSNTDIIESQLQRKVILSKSNMGLMIVETDVTKEYYLLLKRYDEIAAISNATALTEKLSQFAGELKATYLLWPKKGIAQPGLEPIETFNHWTLYQFAN